MDYKKGKDRGQVYLTSLEEMVDVDSFARIIDLLVDELPLEELGFENMRLNREDELAIAET